MHTATTFDWQSWLACGLGLLAVLHLTKRWWPKHLGRQATAPAAASSTTGCEVEAPSACGGGGCGGCGASSTPIRVHRRTLRDTPGATPGA